MLQLPLNVQLDDSARFTNFFPSSNQQLVQQLESLSHNDADFIYIWGAKDCGKTHLAQALCHCYDEKNLTALYLPLSNPDLSPEVLIGMSHMDLVCLDDLDAINQLNPQVNTEQSIALQSQWEEQLFDLYNNLKIEHKKLVVFSKLSPAHSTMGLADLNSRLMAMEIYKLESLNDEQKLDFFQQRAANRGIDISPEVARFILTRQGRSVSELIALLDKIDHSTIALKRKVTIPLIKEIFDL